jgi:hypothetical protein
MDFASMASASSLPDPIEIRVQAVFETDERVHGPQALFQLFPCDSVSRPFQQQAQNLKGFLLQFDFVAIPPHLGGSKINFKILEPRLF